MRLVWVLLIAVLLSSPGWGAAISVSPVRIRLLQEQPVASVRVRNDGDSAVLLQAETFRWRIEEGRDVLAPTRALIAVPPLFRLEPGASQLVRIGLRVPFPEQREESYRLFLTEVVEADERPAQGVRFALRLSLPVFAVPEGARPDVRWRLLRVGGRWLLEADNRGRAHLRVEELTLVHPGGGTWRVPDAAAYVLAESRMRWRVPNLPLRPGERIALRLRTQQDTIRVELRLEEG